MLDDCSERLDDEELLDDDDADEELLDVLDDELLDDEELLSSSIPRIRTGPDGKAVPAPLVQKLSTEGSPL